MARSLAVIDRQAAAERHREHEASVRKVLRLQARLKKVQADADRALDAIREEVRAAERDEMRACERLNLANRFAEHSASKTRVA